MKNSDSEKSVSLKTDHLAKAKCLLIEAKGKYFYGEAFNKFIEIHESEYRLILSNPHLYYFSTALEKHYKWRDAVRKGETFTFTQLLDP